MSRSLPSRPNPAQLRNQAKDLLKAHGRGDKAVCNTLRLLRRFADTPDETILQAEIALHDVQYALALEYGFNSWSTLIRHVQSLPTGRTTGRVRHEAGRVWIDGLPGLTRQQTGTCTFAGALAAALAVTERPFTYSQIMGYSGLAFRVRWYRRRDIADWCPSSPVGEFPSEINTVQRATGWQLDVSDTESSTKDELAKRSERIVASIDKGLPVTGHLEDMDMATLYGYEHRDDGLHFIWESYNSNQPQVLPESRIPRMVIIMHDGADPMDETDRFIQALTTPNWRQHSWTPSNYPEKRDHSYLLGDRAFETWADDISKADSFTEEQQQKLFFVNWWCFPALCDARIQAADFLRDHAELFDGEIARSLHRAADIYHGESELIKKSLQKGEAILGPWTGKSIAMWTPEVRRTEVNILRKVREDDAAAVRELDTALKLYKSQSEIRPDADR